MLTLVTGATGRIGSIVRNKLQSKGVAARAAVRDCKEPNDVAFDWTNPSGWTEATSEVEQVFLMTPESMGNMGEQAEAFLDVAKKQGLRRVVLLSALGVDKDDHGTGMAHIEAAVRWSFEDHCIFRANTFMQNFSAGPFYPSIMERGSLVAPLGDARISMIDLRDIAQCIVHSLMNSNVAGKFTLTGTEALSFSDAASAISAVTNRQIGYEDVPDAMMQDTLRNAGMPPHLVEMIMGFYTSLRDPAHAEITSCVQEITGRYPRSFGDFVSENKEVWKNHV